MASGSLKELLRENPKTKAGLRAVLEEIGKDGPRGAAISGATIVENALEDLIKSKIRKDLTKTESDELFGNDGPLESFSAKIRLGFALELYGRKTRHDLESVKEIRNVFAHARTAVRFENPRIMNKCSGFHCTRAISARHKGRVLYIQAVCWLAVHLLAQLHDGKAHPETAELD